MPNILIHGIDTLPGTHLAAKYLESPDNRVFYSAGTPAGIERAVRRIVHKSTGHTFTGSRARLLPFSELTDNADPNAAHLDAVWLMVSAQFGRPQVDQVRRLLSSGVVDRAQKLNYAVFDEGGVRTEEEIPDGEIAAFCNAKGLEYRIFHASLVVGEASAELGKGTGAFWRFLAALHALKTEIEERSSQYFDFQALRVLAPPEAGLNLIPAELAVELFLRIVETPAMAGGTFAVVAKENTTFAAVCERIAIAYGIGVLPVDRFDRLNAIDRIFHERSGDFHGYLMGGSPAPPNLDAYRAAGLSPGDYPFNEDEQIALLESLRADQDETWSSEKERAEGLPEGLAAKKLPQNGATLEYYVAGTTGPAIILLNALGQRLNFWFRLMAKLMGNYRLIVWEPRGTVAPPPPFGLDEQIADAEAILRQENIETCHLVGWCTGPKVAMEVYLRHPSLVRSMAFLNATFKCKGSPEELDSAYEHNMESLCRMLMRKPAAAATARQTFRAKAEDDEREMLKGPDNEEISVNVLSRMNVDVRTLVLAPFETEETILNYAHQLTDFWSYDSRPKARQIQVPVLLMGAEYDQVATPATSEIVSALFPKACHVHVSGATHYCLYDRAEFVADLLRTFFETPDELIARYPAHREAAQVQ